MLIRRLFGRSGANWSIKVLALAAAVLLFFYNRIVSLDEAEFTVPLQVNISNELAIAESYPESVHVRVRGSEEAIEEVSGDDFEARADATRHTSPGRYQVGVSVRRTSKDASMQSLDIRVEPMAISLALDPRISAEVQVEPNLRGRPASGYELLRSSVAPAEVVIEGPERYIEGRSSVSTEEIDIAGRDESFTTRVPLEAPNELLDFRGGRTVEFRGIIEERIVTETVDGITIDVINLSEQFTLSFTTREGEAVLRGPFSAMESVTREGVSMSVNASEIDEPGVYELPVVVQAPEDVSLVEFEPPEISVEARVSGSGEDQAATGGFSTQRDSDSVVEAGQE
ncbi:MAG: YbbR-like domain-containing protein [Spirochaetia bacterium]